MSPTMTFRQKLIRISSSAAICGLSYSFAVGEYVDSQAKLLRHWVVDPQLLPKNYLPLRPLQATLERIETSSWKESLLATNSLPALSPPESHSSVKVVPVVAPDLVKLASGSPEKEAKSSPLDVVIIGKKAIPDTRSAAEMEMVLGSIHATATKLSKPAIAPPSRESDLSPENTQQQVLTQGTIQGRIVAPASVSEVGHFEVGLYAKIDHEGNPIGFPMVQQILPRGQSAFRMEVPSRIESGYLFGEFVASKTNRRTVFAPVTNPWQRVSRELVELVFKPEDSIASVASAPNGVSEVPKEKWRIQGTVTTMFVAGAAIPQEDVVVKVRGRRESTRTGTKGAFTLEVPRMKGSIYIELLKSGYHPVIVEVDGGDTKPLQLEIASRHAINQIAQRLGANQSPLKGVFMGKASGKDGTPLKGLTAQLSLKSEGPFYFDDEGTATRDLRATSGNARFIFLNVEPGTGFLETSLNGEQIAPMPVSMVEGGELLSKRLTPVSGHVRGRIFNPVASVGGKVEPISGARVRVDGASEWVSSDSYGAFSIGPMRWMKGERLSLEMTAERFNNHRYLVSADRSGSSLSLFAFPAAYIGRLAASMEVEVDLFSGVVIGKVGGPSLRIDALADHSSVNNARDFYFDSKGRLKGSHEMTDPRFGTYVIFNVPKGRVLLQGNDSSGTLRYSEAVVTSPASINVQMD